MQTKDESAVNQKIKSRQRKKVLLQRLPERKMPLCNFNCIFDMGISTCNKKKLVPKLNANIFSLALPSSILLYQRNLQITSMTRPMKKAFHLR